MTFNLFTDSPLNLSLDEAGNVIAVTDAEGHTTHFEYDAMNRRTAATDATGYRSTTGYNARGEVVAVTNANGETVRTEYDALGRRTARVDALVGYRSEFAYDANGNLTCTVDANAQAGLQPRNRDGCSESRVYDELNRVILIVDALNGETAFTYDYQGNRLTVKDAENKTWSFAYDDLGRLKSETDHSGKSLACQSDEAGNVFQKTNRLNEITRTAFDALNRPIRVDYLKDGTWETFGFDPAGNRNAAANGSVSYSFRYDRLNRLLSKTDSRGKSLAFTWDRAGHLLTKTTYQGSTTHYTYDGAGTLVSLSNPDYLSVSYQYDNGGRLLSRVMSSGAKSLYAYDAGGWLSSLTHTDAVGAPVVSQTYTRDRVGNITGVNVTAGPNAGATSYTLDALYRLTAVDAPGMANDEGYSYDRLGNRLIATRGSTTAGASGTGITSRYAIYTAASQTGMVAGYTPGYRNRLKEIRLGSTGGTLESGFTFDHEGRLAGQTGSTPRTLTWDAKGRLKTLTQGGKTETYRYDPMDHRIGRSGGNLGNLDYYLEGEHLESVEQSGALQEKYFRGSTVDELVAGYVSQGGKLTPLFFQHDHLMGVAAQTKPNGGTQGSLAYTAFGETLATTGTPWWRLKYTGREDDGTGLYYYRARYYDPKFGFISEDPIRFAAGPSFYAYVGNNPINANDPSGHAAMQVGGAVVGAVGGLIVQGGIDLARGRMSSFADYAGSFTGGAAGGAAAVTCGPACAGATAGAVSSATTQGINWAQGQAASAWNFVTDTALGAVGGKAAGTVVPYLFKTALPNLVGVGTANQIKGQIGETMSAIGLIGTGRSFTTQVENGVIRNGQASTFDFGLSGYRNFVETKWGTATLSSAQREAAQIPGTSLSMHQWGYPTVSGIAGSSFAASSAGGGFLLYPNKANTNMMQSVYSK